MHRSEQADTSFGVEVSGKLPGAGRAVGDRCGERFQFGSFCDRPHRGL